MDDVDRATDLADARTDVAITLISKSIKQSNTTGICIECDEPIEPERLAVTINPNRCILCQEAAEKHARIRRF